MIFEIGRYIINFGAIVAVEFSTTVSPDGVTKDAAIVHLTGPVARLICSIMR